ncbi:regulator of chromosome condensation 1/beta-lactamase-inhibitor protein II [Pisolithus albus]|nr:regulator of chromosome condensation 1/beta-lactamase-inhibitor protein II [Pisolithus albus]
MPPPSAVAMPSPVDDGAPVQARPAWRVAHKPTRRERAPKGLLAPAPAPVPQIEAPRPVSNPNVPAWAQWRSNLSLMPSVGPSGPVSPAAQACHAFYASRGFAVLVFSRIFTWILKVNATHFKERKLWKNYVAGLEVNKGIGARARIIRHCLTYKTSGARPFRLFRVSGSQLECWESPPGNSWSRKSVVSALEMNAFDHLGRTVLHLVCSSTDVSNTEYARMLLLHPNVNVNMPDKENHWTASHRALYCGNIEAAIPLLKHSDIDASIKGFEGCTAFDLYNSTIPTTKPLSYDERIPTDLFTWGTNRNAALGLGDANYRIFPGPVVLPMKDVPRAGGSSLEDRFRTVRVCDIKMSKLHMAYEIVRIDRFLLQLSSQVRLATIYGYAASGVGDVETNQGRFVQEPVQSTPRKISQLKREFIKGVAACKIASACWSNFQVWTWGTNNGQLGYQKTATPVQVFPRQETATACLFISGEVVCIWHGGMSRVNFPAHSFPSEISMYRPPQAIRGTAITKIISCEDSFVALSSNGEVFTFSVPTASELDGLGLSGRREKLIKPQQVWALRRQVGSVRDVDIGGDDTLIVCTRSGHIYRVVAVCANSTGSFGALRVKFKPSPIQVTGRSFEADMTAIMPFVPKVSGRARATGGNRIPANDETDDAEVLDDIGSLEMLMDMLRRPEGVLFDKVSALLNVADSRLSTHDGSQTAFDADPSPLSLPLWGRRVGLVLAEQCKAVGILPMQIKCELVTLAGLLELPQVNWCDSTCTNTCRGFVRSLRVVDQ